MTLRDWLSHNSDDLFATVFVAILVALGVGFRKRSTGLAIFLSGFSAAALVVVAYPIFTSYGYDWRIGVSVLAPVCGACSWAIFGVLVALSDRIDARRSQIADKLVDKAEGFFPGGKP